MLGVSLHDRENNFLPQSQAVSLVWQFYLGLFFKRIHSHQWLSTWIQIKRTDCILGTISWGSEVDI